MATLSWSDLAAASAILLLDGLLSVRMRLDVHRQLGIAAVRLIVQLVALGYLLRLVFAIDVAWMTFAVIAAMTLAAAREAASRSMRRLKRGHFVMSLVGVGVPSLLTCLFALVTMLRPEPLWSPRYAIPLAGILLGNVLTAVSLSLDGVLDGAKREAPAIEARLLLGHSMREATAPLARRSVQRALIPLLNQMSAAGIITMPGIMTGQVLSGLDPLYAATYQIALMLLLAGGSALASFMTVRLSLARLSDERERLRLDRLSS